MGMADGAWNDQLNCFNIDNSMPLIHLKYRMPADINDATGTMFDTKKGQLTADSNLFFSGIYQVSKVESSIKNGAFTQILHMVRLNNQQGIGVAPFQNTNITDAFVQKNTDDSPAIKNHVPKVDNKSIQEKALDGEIEIEHDYQKKMIEMLNESKKAENEGVPK